MAVRKLTAKADSLDAMTQREGTTGVATWATSSLQLIVSAAGFAFDQEFSCDLPLVIQFVRQGCTEADGEAIISSLVKALGVQFQRGVQNTYSPFVRLSNRFMPIPGVSSYLVVTLNSQGQLAVKLAV